MKRWLQEPLLHFLLIGAVFFLLFYQVADPEEVADDRIVISEADIERIITLYERKLQRLPTQAELNGLVEAEIREQILYREALAMGLDEDDTIVRRRMAQKVEFLFNDLVDVIEPTDGELQKFLDAHPDKFSEPARTSFIQVYFNADRRGDKVTADARQLLSELVAGQAAIESDDLGDPFMFGSGFDNQSDQQLARMFGSEFALALDSVDAGSWQGPITSAYGLHLVNIKQRTEARLPALGEVRDSVLYEVLAERRQQANQAFYKALRERYQVIVEEQQAQVRIEAGMESVQ
ncbi:MAG: peptidyl-prolyl cis-trans isomerase [Gammaproteobacteria bacterium]|nr:peptidyl-prolyl cis-trans isomerase [Gammaproteobacteria bacterium]